LPPSITCPTASPLRHFGKSGGLLIRGPNTADTFLRSTSYLDRIARVANWIEQEMLFQRPVNDFME
jgi:hypothetical protein